MSSTRLITIFILTVTSLPFVKPYLWGSRTVQETQNIPAPPSTPINPPPPVSQSGNDRFLDIARRLQIGGIGASVQPKAVGGEYLTPAVISYNPGYQPYDPRRNNPAYFPSQSYPGQGYAPVQGNPGYNPGSGQGNPGYNPGSGYPYQASDPRPIPDPGYYGGYPDQRQNPAPAYPQWPQSNPGYDPRAPQQSPSIYPDFRQNVPPVRENPVGFTPDPYRPNMRPAPKGDDPDYRNRDNQNSAWNQWAASLIYGPTFWDRSEGR